MIFMICVMPLTLISSVDQTFFALRVAQEGVPERMEFQEQGQQEHGHRTRTRSAHRGGRVLQEVVALGERVAVAVP
jgi:hypothetical protein